MTIIEQMERIGFLINWTLIYIGYEGRLWLKPLLGIQDICDYALGLLERMTSGYILVAQLITEQKSAYDFEDTLKTLARLETVSADLQLRKWRVYLVDERLKTLSTDYFEGLIELTELWLGLGDIKDCPHIIRGINNNYSPNEYYTKNMYEYLVEKNKDWLAREIRSICSNERRENRFV